MQTHKSCKMNKLDLEVPSILYPLKFSYIARFSSPTLFQKIFNNANTVVKARDEQ